MDLSTFLIFNRQDNLPLTKKYTIPVVALLCLYIVATADKIEKKGTILNSKCNPIGTKCSSTVSGISLPITPAAKAELQTRLGIL